MNCENKVNIFLILILLVIVSPGLTAQEIFASFSERPSLSLDGSWKIIIDPYENGYYDYRWEESPNGFFRNEKPKNKWDRIEYNFDTSDSLTVPGDWNSQKKELFFYEGTVWYKKSFDILKKSNTRLFLRFGAVNYRAVVYLNGKKLGSHEGGFSPFSFEISRLVREKDNFVVVKADNKRCAECVPTLNTDWWNYGGITRSVSVVETPASFIGDYSIQLQKGSLKNISGWIQVNSSRPGQPVTVELPDLKIRKRYVVDSTGSVQFSFQASVKLWSPEHPALTDVILTSETDTVRDRIGFRTIETQGSQIHLNGKQVFLRGISIHEEAPFRSGRANSPDDAHTLLGWAKELGCNFVRLAHYPHNEYMLKEADRVGLMVWSEIPVYWTIKWENEQTYNNASRQLTEMIGRDRNRGSVICWSVSNETPLSAPRLEFLKGLIRQARGMDSTRLLTAAMERHYVDASTQLIDDPLGEFVDVLGCNEYIGWYDGLPNKADTLKWKTIYQKPFIISEFGGSALYGLHGDSLTIWSEEYQESLYRHQIAMLKKIPFLCGMSPWILMDFRSPRRQLPGIQDYRNRKGLISDKGERKKAFFVLQSYYEEMRKKQD
jgi:beta-glucuronidase